MKNILCILMVLSLCCPKFLFGQDLQDDTKLSNPVSLTEKEKKSFKKFAEKIGIIKYSELEGKNPKDFWNYVSENNVRHNKFMEAYSKGTKMAKNSVKKVAEGVERDKIFRSDMEFIPEEDLVETINGFEDTFKEYLCDGDIQVEIIDDTDVNAFATPDGYIGLNLGCLLKEWISDYETFYLMGHEYAHVRLSHRVVHEYFHRKEKFKTNLIAGISTAAIAAASLYNVSQGVADTTSFKNIPVILSKAEEAKENFYYKFSREEEFEADVYSTYYLMNRGFSPYHSINLLQDFVECFGDAPTDDYDEHPSNTQRIKFLYYILTEYNKE